MVVIRHAVGPTLSVVAAMGQRRGLEWGIDAELRVPPGGTPVP